jgi:hypothetical protein
LVPGLFAALTIAFVPGHLQAAVEHSTAARSLVVDPSGDSSPGHADIKSVTPAGEGATVTWTIVTYGNFATAKAPCVDIVSVQPGGLHWTICGNAQKGFGIQTSRPYPRGGGYSGTASVSRPNQKTVTYKVNRGYITAGTTLTPKPHGSTWQVQVLDQPACVPSACDRAPDGKPVPLPA